MALDIISYGESQNAKELALQNKIDIWQQNTSYGLDKYISENNLLYKCTTAHTSTTIFENDILNWQLIGSNPIDIKNDTSLISSNVKSISFVGAVVTEANGQVKVEISGGSALPYNVSTYTSTINITTAIQIIYNWTNPVIANGYVKTVLFVSTEDISASTYVFDLANESGNIQKIKEGGTQGASDSFAFDCAKDLTYYSKIFVVYDFGNGEVYSSGKNLTTSVVDTTAPVDPTSISAIAGNGKITVSWVDSASTDTLGYLVRWKNSTFTTTDKTEGNMLTDVGVGVHNVIHSGLSNTDSPIYYYKIFAYDNSKIANYNTSNINTCSATLDGTPPLDVGTISQLALNQSIKVTWQTNDNTNSDWKGVRLVIKQGTDYPSNITDGTFIDIFNVATKTYSFGGLINNQTYSIQLFPFDTNLNYNINTVNRIQGTPFASALNDLLSFTCKNITNGSQIEADYKINYAPNGTTYQNTKIYGSKLTNLDGKTMVDCAGDSTIFLLKTDTTATQGSSSTYVLSNTDTNLPFVLGDMVYFKGFMTYLEGSSVGISNGITVQDQTPPSIVASFIVTSQDSQCSITWVNPSDNGYFQTKILRKLGGYPTSETDSSATIIYDGTNTTVVDTGLVNATTYYYKAFPYDSNSNYNENSIGVTATPQALQVYSITYNELTDVYTRKDLNVGKTSSDLINTIAPFITKRCILSDSAVVSYYLNPTDSNYKEDSTSSVLDGTVGQVMVEYSKFWYKVSYANNVWTYSISATTQVGYSAHPMFIHNSVTYDKAYIAVCEGYKNVTTNKMESRSGVTPTTGLDVSTMNTLAVARGSNWSVMDKNSLDGISMFNAIIYGTFNFQSVIGSGVTADTAIHNTGETLLLGNSTGNAGGLNDGKHAISINGIENLFGNIHHYISGIIISDTKMYLADNNYNSFVSEASLGTYSAIANYVPTVANGFINSIQYLSTNPYLFIGKTFTGSNSSFYTDYQYSKDGTGSFAYGYLGYKYDGGNKAGMFAMQYVNTSNNTITRNNSATATLTSGTEYTFSIDKSVDGLLGAKPLTSISLVDGTIPTLTLNYALTNVGCRLQAWK